MIDPKDIMNVKDEDWEAFKKSAQEDEMYYKGSGDMLDTAEGRAKFCRLNESSVFNKPDPEAPGYKIWVYNLQGRGMTIKKRSKADPRLMECIEYNADGEAVGKSYDPA